MSMGQDGAPRSAGRSGGAVAFALLCAASSAFATENLVANVTTRAVGSKTVVTVHGSATPSFTAYRLERPARVVVDLANGRLANQDGPIDVDTWAVGQIAMAQYSDDVTRTARVMIGFKRPSSYDVRAEGHDVIITVTPDDAPPADQQKSAAEAELRQKKAESALVEVQKAMRDARLEEERRVARQLDAKKAETEALERAETARREATAAKARALAAQAELEHVTATRTAEQARIEQLKQEAQASGQKQSAELARTLAETARVHEARVREQAQLEALRGEAEQLVQRRAEEARKLAEAQAQARKLAEVRAAKLAELERAAERRAQASEQATKRAEEARAEQVKLEALRSESARLAAEAESAKVELNRSRAEHERLLALQSGERQRLEQARVEAKRVAAERAEAVERAAHAVALTSQSTLKMELAEREARRVAQERVRDSARLEQVQKETAALAQKRMEELKRIDEARAEAKRIVVAREAELEALSTQRAAEESKLAAARKERSSVEESVANARKERSSMEQSVASAREERSSLEESVASARKELLRIEREAKQRLSIVPTPEKIGAPLAKIAAPPAKSVAAPPKIATIKVPSRVHDVRFADDGDRERVIVDIAGDPEVTVLRSDKHTAVLRIAGADLPRKLERTLDVAAYDGPLKSISTYRDPQDPGAVRLVAALSDDAGDGEPKVGKERGQLSWEFPRAASSRSYPPERMGAFGTSLPLQLAQATPVVPTPMRQIPMAKRKVYTGRRIDLDFKDIDIHNVLRLLADFGQVNIITTDDVKGTITIRMMDVPWDQALDVILRSKGLAMQRDGNLIRVAPQATLEKEAELEVARAKAAVELKPIETRLMPLSYADGAQLLPRIQDVMSSRGKVSVDARTNMLIVSDVGSNIALAEDLVRNLDTQTPQVLIESRIVEARTTFLRDIGVQWGGNSINSTATGNPTGIAFPSTVGLAGGAVDNVTNSQGLQLPAAASPNYVVNLPAAVGTGSGGALGLTLGSVAGNVNINLRLSSLENSGNVRIISAPRITTLDNIEASIEQGVAIPISTVSAAGTNTVFVDAKLNLTVKPHITNEGSVIMNVQITRNEPDFVNTGARGDPSILKKQARTEMLVRDGDTAVIGGIYTRNTGLSYTKVPWFADIPVIGWLFKNRRENDDRTELLIFITPRIVNRATARR